jgi:hypothetical protein
MRLQLRWPEPLIDLRPMQLNRYPFAQLNSIQDCVLQFMIALTSEGRYMLKKSNSSLANCCKEEIMRRKIILVALFAVLTSTSAFAQSKHVLNKPSPIIAIHNIIGNKLANLQSSRQQEIDRIREILRNLHRPRPVSP